MNHHRHFYRSLLVTLILPACLCAQTDLSFRSATWDWDASITGTISHVSFKNWASDGVNYSYVAGLKSSIDPRWSDGLWSFEGSWDGRFSVFGGNSLPPRKTEDRCELNLKFGRMIAGGTDGCASLSLVVFTDIQTQFLPDYDFIGDPDGRNYISNFFAPASMTDGIGLDYRDDSLGLSVVVTPLASKQTMIFDRGVDRTYFHMDPGQNVKSLPGAYARVKFSRELLPRTTLSIRSIFFADYSKKSTVDLSFLGEIDHRIVSFLKIYASLTMVNDDDIDVRLYEDLDNDGSSDDFAGIGHGLQLYGQFGIGINIDF